MSFLSSHKLPSLCSSGIPWLRRPFILMKMGTLLFACNCCYSRRSKSHFEVSKVQQNSILHPHRSDSNLNRSLLQRKSHRLRSVRVLHGVLLRSGPRPAVRDQYVLVQAEVVPVPYLHAEEIT